MEKENYVGSVDSESRLTLKGDCHQITFQVQRTGLVPDNGRVYPQPRVAENYYLHRLTRNPDSRLADPIESLYPGLPIHHLCLEIPDRFLLEQEDGSLLAPFAIDIGTDLPMAAIVSYQGVNPMTGTPAIREMAREELDGQLVPNWLYIPTESNVSLWGFVEDPTVLPAQKTVARQSVFKASSPEYFFTDQPNKEGIQTVSILFFEQWVVRLFCEEDGVYEPITPDYGSLAHKNGASFLVVEGGLVAQSFPEDEFGASVDEPLIYFEKDPAFLVRLHLKTSLGRLKLRNSIATSRR